MDKDLVRQVGVVVAVAAGIGSGATGDYGSAGDADTVFLVPPDWSFVIWVPVYAGAIGYAAHQARPSRRRDPLLRATGWPAATAYLASGLWVRTNDRPRWEIGVIAVTTLAAAAAHVRSAPTSEHRGATPGTALGPALDAWLVRAPIGLFTGWISLASVVATAQALKDAGGRGAATVGGEPASAALLLAAGGIGAAVTAAVPSSPAYPAALAWGLVGVCAARLRDRPAVGVAAGVAAAAVVGTSLRARGARARCRRSAQRGA